MAGLYNRKVKMFFWVALIAIGLSVVFVSAGVAQPTTPCISSVDVPCEPPPVVPEPASMLLLATGLLGLAILKKRKGDR